MGLADLFGADSCVTRIANEIEEVEFQLSLAELQKNRWSMCEINHWWYGQGPVLSKQVYII